MCAAPNFIVIFTDDQGVRGYRSVQHEHGRGRPRTPNLDRMAAEGIRLTDFYVAQAVCSASRAALLTGTYPNRVGTDRRARHLAAAGQRARRGAGSRRALLRM